MNHLFKKFEAQLETAALERAKAEENTTLYRPNFANENVSTIFKYLYNNESLVNIDFDSFSIEDCFRASLMHYDAVEYIEDDEEYGECYLYYDYHPLSYLRAFGEYKMQLSGIPKTNILLRKFI